MLKTVLKAGLSGAEEKVGDNADGLGSTMASTADQGLLQSGPLDAHFPIGFKVWPRKIELKSFKTGKKYVTWLSVRNDTAAVRRVRILPPATSPFAIEYQEEGALISPGITTKVKVIFKSSDLVASYDTVRVVTGDSSSEQLDVPLSAFPPGPEIEFNKLVNLGVVITNATARKTFALRNMGEIPGKFTIESAKDDQLLFDKTEGQLAPKGEMGDMTNVSLEITATEAGEFRAVYKVKLDTVVGERVEILTVVGTVLEPSLTQTIPGQGPLDKVNFGDLYFGQTRVVRSHLVNNSPLATPFVITISSNEDMDDLNGEPDPYVSVFPAEGKLEPYTQIQISYVFQPQRLLQNKGFKSQVSTDASTALFERSAIIDCPNVGQSLTFPISGRAVEPLISLSRQILEFGKITVKKTEDLDLVIKNKSADLPISFDFKKIAQFSVQPMAGKLSPQESQTVTVTFKPQNLGVFKESLLLSVEKSILSFALPVTGVAVSSNVQLRSTRQPADPYQYPMQPDFSESLPVGVAPVSPKAFEYNYTHSTQGLEGRKSHRQQYADFLNIKGMEKAVKNRGKLPTYPAQMTSRDPRVRAHGLKDQVKVDPEDPVSLGLAFAQGLDSPRPKLPVADTALRLKYAMGGLAGAGKKPFKKAKGRKKKLKKLPTTQAERRDCDTALSQKEINQIVRGPKRVELGRLFLEAEGSAEYTVFNQLEKHILVELDKPCDELSRSGPASQLVPPGETAVIQVKFSSSFTQEFKKSLTYTINGDHHFSFEVTAEVVPVQLRVSKEELDFAFAPDNDTFSTTEQVTLTNPSNAGVDFWLSAEHDVFACSPNKGTLGPFESAEVTVTYSPSSAMDKFYSSIVLQVKNGPAFTFPCHGALPECSLEAKVKNFELGTVCVGQAVTLTCVVRNKSKTRTVIACPDVPYAMKVQPTSALVEAGASLPLHVTMYPTKQEEFSESLPLDIRGRGKNAKPFALTFSGSSIIPEVEVLQDEVDFGSITLGSTSEQHVGIINRSIVEVLLFLDITNYPEFSISYPAAWDQLDDPPICVADPEPAEEGGAAVVGGPEQRKYKLCIKPETTLAFHMTYEPARVATHAFQLPLQVAGIQSYPGVRRVVSAKGLKPTISLNVNRVDFGRKIVIKKERVLKNPYSSTLQLNNEELDREVRWQLTVVPVVDSDDEESLRPSTAGSAGEEAVEEAAWKLSHLSGVIGPGQQEQVKVFFMPVLPMSFHAEVRLFIDDEEEPYLTVPLTGASVLPMLTFSSSEVVLPVVPLGTSSSTRFTIYNKGYENVELRSELPDSHRWPVSVSFPEGSVLSNKVQSIPAVVTCSTLQPASFVTDVDFLDAESRRFSIKLVVLIDNCLLTNQPFLHANRDTYTLVTSEDKGINFLPQGAASKADQKRDSRPRTQMRIRAELPQNRNTSQENFYQRSARALLSFVTASAAALAPSASSQPSAFKEALGFPAQLIKQNGKPLVQLVRALSGKNPLKIPSSCQVPELAKSGSEEDKAGDKGSKPGSPGKGFGVSNKQSRQGELTQCYSQYRALLNFLKSQGALVSSFKPEHFLSAEQHKLLLGRPDAAGKLSLVERQKEMQRLEEAFPQQSRMAWLGLLQQVVKVFVLNRVTARHLKALPGIPSEVADEPLQVSNLYSPAELVLLRWLSFHYDKVSPHNSSPVSNFDTHLASGTVLAAVLQSHVPSLASLNDMINAPETEVDRVANAQCIKRALEEMDLSYKIEPRDMATPVASDLLLFCLFLYQKLPSFTPRTTILFRGMLNEVVTKHVELSNPSKKPITYAVRLEGCNDFSVSERVVELAGKGKPGSTASVKITFQSRFSSLVEGRLTFASSSSSSGSTLVFLLRSQVLGRIATQNHEVTTPCYEEGTFMLDFHNPLSQDLYLQVSMDKLGSPGGSGGGGVKKKGGDDATTVAGQPTCLYTKVERLKVKAGGSAKIPIQFLPLHPGPYHSQLLFLDPAHGEFVHDVFATATLPMPLDTVKWTAMVNSNEFRDVAVPSKNSLLERAVKAHLHRLKRRKKDRLDAAELVFLQNPEELLDVPLDAVYSATSSSSYFTVPRTVTLGGPSGGAASPSAKQLDAMRLQFQPKEPGVYRCEVMLRSSMDVKMLHLEVMVDEEAVVPLLTFRSPARRAVTQMLPVFNGSQDAWNLRCVISNRCFSGPSTLVIQPGTTEEYPLQFLPFTARMEKGRIELENARTKKSLVFDLIGEGLEPVAEEHLELSCKVRERLEHTLSVSNPTESPIQFKVESDLPYLAGQAGLSVSGHSSANYQMSFTPQLGGTYNGSVSFIGGDGSLVWYAVTLTVEPPLPHASLSISAVLREHVSTSIEVSNPLDKAVSFDVQFHADYLTGPSTLELGPKETAKYNFEFAPLRAGRTKGAVALIHVEAGELWYQLDLEAEMPAPVVLETFECMLGAQLRSTVVLTNPLDEEVVVSGSSSAPRAFFAQPSTVILPARGSAEVSLCYTPSEVGRKEFGTVTFAHAQAGTWEYKLSGLGEEPGVMEEKTVSSAIESRLSTTLPFRNPFAKRITVEVSLESEEPVFALFKKTSVSVPPYASAQIPFTFSPKLIKSHKGALHVLLKKVPDHPKAPPIKWTFPLIGQAEGPTSGVTKEVVVKARSKFQDVLEFKLSGLTQDFAEETGEESFVAELEAPQQHQTLLDHSLRISLVSSVLRKGQDTLQLKVKFEPLKPVSVAAMLVIYKQSGGHWRFPMALVAEDAAPDDVIRIEAAVGTTAKVSFRLTNRYRQPAPFRAWLAPSSAPEFRVGPRAGQLAAAGTEGTQFIISFNPQDYGKQVRGLFIIETELMRWTFALVGKLPRYVVPRPESQLNMSLSKEAQEALQRKRAQAKVNFMKRNVNAAASPTKSPRRDSPRKGRGRSSPRTTF